MVPQLIHKSSRSFHNLKKFSVLAELKFTRCVQKDLRGNILSAGRNHRMPFERILDGRQMVCLPANPGMVRVIAIELRAGCPCVDRPFFAAAAYYALAAQVWANWPSVSGQVSYSRSCYCSAGNLQVWPGFAGSGPGCSRRG